IVAGGDHHSAVEFIVEGGEVDLLGAAQADAGDLRACRFHAERRGAQQARRAVTHVTADDDALRAKIGGECPADAEGRRFVQLFRHAAANVIGLEDLFQCHSRALPVSCSKYCAVVRQHPWISTWGNDSPYSMWTSCFPEPGKDPVRESISHHAAASSTLPVSTPWIPQADASAPPMTPPAKAPRNCAVA